MSGTFNETLLVKHLVKEIPVYLIKRCANMVQIYMTTHVIILGKRVLHHNPDY